MKRGFLDIGGKRPVPENKIVVILDADSATVSETTREFLKRSEKKGEVRSPEKKITRVNSFIITNSHGQDEVLLSPLGTAILQKRTTENILNNKL